MHSLPELLPGGGGGIKGEGWCIRRGGVDSLNQSTPNETTLAGTSRRGVAGVLVHRQRGRASSDLHGKGNRPPPPIHRPSGQIPPPSRQTNWSEGGGGLEEFLPSASQKSHILTPRSPSRTEGKKEVLGKVFENPSVIGEVHGWDSHFEVRCFLVPASSPSKLSPDKSANATPGDNFYSKE